MDKEFIRKVDSFIEEKNMINTHDHVVVGVSAGPDSVALFLVLCELREKYSMTLSVVHVNHGLRPEAREEAAYVESLCKAYNVEFHLFEYDLKKESERLHLGTEEAGRKLRYDCFEKIAGTDGKIAIAHNLNDRSETMLFHLCRGTGPKGMAAIKAVNHKRIRPLLCVERREIEAFLHNAGVKYYIDSSNLENDYTRNKLRNMVFPLLNKEINSEAIKHFAMASELIEDQNDFINMVAKEELSKLTLEKEAGKITISRFGFNNLHITVKREIAKLLIDYLVEKNKDITLSHLNGLIELSAKEGNFDINLPYAIEGRLEYDKLSLSFAKEKKEDNDKRVILDQGQYKVEGLGQVKVEIFDRTEDFILLQKEYTKYFDYDKINCCLELRNRAHGDYLMVNSHMGKKKLKDFFIDNKVPKEERDKTFLVADGSHILWIVGSRISEFYKISDNTRKIVSIEIIKEEA